MENLEKRIRNKGVHYNFICFLKSNIIIRVVDTIKYSLYYWLSLNFIDKFIGKYELLNPVVTVVILIMIFAAITVKFEKQNYDIIFENKPVTNTARIITWIISVVTLILFEVFALILFNVNKTIFDFTLLIILLQVYLMIYIYLLSRDAFSEIKSSLFLQLYNLVTRGTYLLTDIDNSITLYKRISFDKTIDYERIEFLPPITIWFILLGLKAIYLIAYVVYYIIENIGFYFISDELSCGQIAFVALIIWANSLVWCRMKKFKQDTISYYFYLKLSFIFILLLDTTTFAYMYKPQSLLIFSFILTVLIVLFLGLTSKKFISSCGKKFKKRSFRTDIENFQLYNNKNTMRDIAKNKLDENQQQLITAVYDNISNGAVLVSGPWGSGKTYLVENTLNHGKEIDLLKFGSGQNMFYAMFRAITSPFRSINLKLNLKNLVDNPELIYILILINLTFIPVLSIIKEPYLYNNNILIVENIKLVMIMILFLNLIALQVLPYIVFSRDINNNRFRQMYLELMKSQISDEVLVIENLDRLEWEEINEVLEIVNYLADKKIVVTADLNYLVMKYENYTGATDENTVRLENYFSRYFKDTINIPLSIEFKIDALKQIARQNKMFIAPYEYDIIRSIINQYNYINIRELEDFVFKYTNKPVINQVSYELFLFANNVLEDESRDIMKLSIELRQKWSAFITKVKLDINSASPVVYSDNVEVSDLLKSQYKYANIPTVENLMHPSYYKNQKYLSPSQDELNDANQRLLTNLRINDDELSIYRKITNNNLIDELKKMALDSNSQAELLEKVAEFLKKEYSIETSEKSLNIILCSIYIDNVLKYND